MKTAKFLAFSLLLLYFLYQLPSLIGWLLNRPRFQQLGYNQAFTERACDALGVLLGVFLVLALTYKKWWQPNVFKKFYTASAFLLSMIVVFGVIKGAYSSLRSIDKLYAYFKQNTGIVGDVFIADDSLGHRGKPNGMGKSLYALSNAAHSVPILLNQEGFRIASRNPYANSDTLMLFLGCSFTWGDYCSADENFATKTARLLKVNNLNCGINAYGLAQMLLLAERMIPKHHPQYVVVQYSPWLSDRARFTFYPSAFGSMPFPFIAKNEYNQYYVHKPYFKSSLYASENKDFKVTPASFLDKIAFIGKVGFPIATLDAVKQELTLLEMKLGLLPEAEKDNSQIERYVYERIYELCAQNNAKMVVLNVGGFGYTDQERMKNHYDRNRFLSTQNKIVIQQSLFIDADSVLRARLKPTENYSKYVLWGKINETDSVVYDNHPNPMAHGIIAQTLAQSIQKY